MPEGLLKPRYMLEHLKAQSASYAKISEMKVDFLRQSDIMELAQKSEAMKCGNISQPLITTIPIQEEIAMTNSTLSLFSDKIQPEIGNQQATQIDLAWLGGFIDGEGYIGFNSKGRNRHGHINYSPAMQITNTDEGMILRAKSIIEKMGVNPYIKKNGFYAKTCPNRKMIWVITIHRMKPLAKVLKKVTPFLTSTKRERARLVLEYCILRERNLVRGSHYNLLSEREIKIIELCRAKQVRGAPETTREAQLEQSKLQKLQLAKAYLHRLEYDKNYEKDPSNHAKTMELQRIRRATPEGKKKESEYRKQLKNRRKDALCSLLTDDDIVHPFAKA